MQRMFYLFDVYVEYIGFYAKEIAIVCRYCILLYNFLLILDKLDVQFNLKGILRFYIRCIRNKIVKDY